jgi:hypothetical protein
MVWLISEEADIRYRQIETSTAAYAIIPIHYKADR